MRSLILLFFFFSGLTSVSAQHTFSVVLKDESNLRVLPGATVHIISVDKVMITDRAGSATFNDLPEGSFVITYSHIGYHSVTDSIDIPFRGNQPLEVLLSAEEEELEEVIITTTRSSRTIADIPTRVEAISGEELDEKGNMKPGDIRMLLNESTGIQTQQTSAASGNSSIRIQGLDGRYTQIIRDGFPLYSGFSGGLGLLQIAPLDLKQVEVIKGSSSTLYGGGAIAGLVNLVSKSPEEESELNFLVNGTSAMGLDASAFYSGKSGKVGSTIYAAYNHGSPYDPSNTGLTAIPKFNRYSLNPKVFVNIDSKTDLILGVNLTAEERTGGDIDFIKTGQRANGGYFEKNKTNRYSSQASLIRELSENARLTVKNSLSTFKRRIDIPDFTFSGDQFASFSEVTYHYGTKEREWVAGLNFVTDQFSEDQSTSFPVRDYSQNTVGAFLQNTWTASERFSLESGLRSDYHNEYGFFVLPRVSALFKEGSFSARLGGGLGYKTPTIFTEDAEKIQFRNVLPIDLSRAKAERSYGGNFDLNYRSLLFNEKVSFSINQLFFYTRIDNPLLLRPAEGGPQFIFEQPGGLLDTRGLETNLKLTYQDFKLFVGYTLADVKQKQSGIETNYPLVARHRLNNVLMYEKEDEWKLGLEAYYFSAQTLNDGRRGKPYWINGFMAERIFERFSLFINFENFLDTRQTRFDTIYSGNLSAPSFTDIYAPVDGFVVNGGIKLKL